MTSRQKLSRSVDGLLLPGLDGSNPLGFLAAMGVLRLTHEFGAGPVSMKWTPAAGTWVPTIYTGSDQALVEDALLDALCDHLANDIAGHPAQLLARLATDDRTRRRRVFLDQLDQTAGNARTFSDWLAALASDFAPADAINQLQTTRKDYHYGNLTSIIKGTDIHHLRRSLFSPWDYADPLDNQSLHLDPSEDRRHAHQWNKPAGDPDRKKAGGMLGANRLAIEAIPLFTSLPEDGTLRTVGFTGNRSTNTRWTWPLWSAKLTLPVVWSLLLLPELQGDATKPDDVATLREMRERGIVAVYRTNRIVVGKTPNFTPPRRIA
jgi:CRISPR-associated endonuclease/helicase Cas3